mmetsp:Transcript_8550/g.25129  ORF Transcript_8550/g.25129 Transcript_8550/m.25129 type:complete len:211 (+) Transcript_8550:57-689(+)
MWRLTARSIRPLCLRARAPAPRQFTTSEHTSTQASAGGLLNPAKVLESLEEVQHKLKELGESTGLPKSLDEVQGKLQELGETLQQRVPQGLTDATSGLSTAASKGITDLLESNSEKLAQTVMPFATAAVILSRASGELSAEQEEKLREVLPGPVVASIKAQIPVLPVDPQLERSKAIVERLDALQAEVQALRAEVAKASATQTAPPPEQE